MVSRILDLDLLDLGKELLLIAGVAITSTENELNLSGTSGAELHILIFVMSTILFSKTKVLCWYHGCS